MTSVSEEAREGTSLAVEQEPESTAPTRACARTSVALPSDASLETATQRVHAAKRVLARTTEFLDRPGSLVHAQPPTFARAREQHHEAAGRSSVPLLRGLRLTWGYSHLLLIKPVLNGLEWVTETPLRLFAAVALALIVYFWS